MPGRRHDRQPAKRRRVAAFAVVVLGVALAAGGCDRPSSSASSAGVLQTGFWHAQITLPGGDIEAGIELGRGGDGYVASLINGQERVPIDEVRYEDGELLLGFPAFNNEIRARLVGGRLEGELILTKRYGRTQSMPFVATHGAALSKATDAPAGADVSGRWAVTFNEPDGSVSPSIGEFSQRGSRLFGTFLHPNGDYRYLSGHVRGRSFRLSTFDGAHAFVFDGEVDGDRIRKGNFWSGTEWHQTWSARRDSSVKLPDAYSRTWLKPGYRRFEFSFPNHEGETVSIDDERFAGKVLVITLAGTWCPNCHDEARFMAPLYEKYRSKGLEVVALMYEHFENREVAARQVVRFRDKFDIGYETLLAGISSKTDAAATLPSLNAVLAFPTTIFVDRSGRVRRIHTGFSGPGTGEHYAALTAEITAFIDELLAEPADLIGSVGADGEAGD